MMGDWILSARRFFESMTAEDWLISGQAWGITGGRG
jgi:hypothetical protein